jgi:glutamine amidotransferase
MCRMVGLVAASPVGLRGYLRDAPRSLWALSKEHPDGWGVAVREQTDWAIHRNTSCAQLCAEFETVTRDTQARVLVAHIRQKTVGPTSLLNTHPFRSGSYVFAHNGTVTAVPALVSATSPERAAAITGDTDSERLFAFLATHVDTAGDVEAGLIAGVRALHALGDVGSITFLFSSGDRIYAHRLGRTLHLLSRGGAARTPAVAIASEQLTDEPWSELPERSLTVLETIDGAPTARALL